jgi:DNA-binding GntR family transcriptional regulator
MIVRELRSSIVDGRLAPGARLPYRDVAHQFNVSVTPVRGALRELAKEGMVEIRPHGGAQVSPLSIEELEELYVVRGALEPWLMRLGTGRLTDGDLSEMESRLRAVRDAAQERDRELYLQTAWAYRVVCYEAAQRPRLLEMTTSLFRRSARYSFLQISEEERLDRSMDYTERLSAACRSRDAEAAASTLTEALRWSLSATLAAYRERTEGARPGSGA